MYSTEGDKSSYTEFPAATVIVLLLFSHLNRLHYAVGCSADVLLFISVMTILTVMQKVLNHDRGPTCTLWRVKPADSSDFFCLYVFPVSQVVADL